MLLRGHFQPAAPGTTTSVPSLSLFPNTSANPITPAFSNGILAGNTKVSKVNVHNMLYTGHTTKVLVHYIPWFDGGLDSGINVNYDTATTSYVNALCTDLVSRGVDGLFVDWQGVPDYTNVSFLATHSVIKNYRTLQNSSATLAYAIMLDANMLGTMSSSSPTGVVLTAMAYISTNYLTDSNYLTYGGKQVVGDFGLTGPDVVPGVNWSAVQAAYPNVSFVHLDDANTSNGFAIANSGGSFAWIECTSITAAAADFTFLTDFYARAKSRSTMCAVGSVFSRFDSDPYAPWNGKIYFNENDGQTYLNCWTLINNVFSATGAQLPFVQIVTWSDYYEGTALETGIDTKVSLSVSVSAMSINLFRVGSGSVNAVDHLELWTYNNGAWAASTFSADAARIPVSFHSSYYIEVVGKPFFKNTLTPSISV